MFSWEDSRKPLSKCTRCLDKDAWLRCTECWDSSPHCTQCHLTAHRHHWFHWVEARRSDDEFWKKYDLSSLDFTIRLGHGGEACPSRGGWLSPSKITICHTNGIHRCQVEFCHCLHAPSVPCQLIQERIWPATLDQPQTAFTTPLLTLYDHLWNVSNVNAYDFIDILQRLTDSAFPDKVPDPYDAFRRVHRMFEHLTMKKRAGHYHGVKIPNRSSDDLTVACLTCPLPSVNLPLDWAQETRAPYIYRHNLGVDACHGMPKRTKNDDKNDKALSEGQGFMVKLADMKNMVEESFKNDDDRVVSCTSIYQMIPLTVAKTHTCSSFKVARAQRLGKFRTVDISGVAAITCRHTFFFHQGVIDLISGER
ncbi:uncharacterized protein BXZ73DRAFT_43076 [Epithele typhae]|uniref:uncharacterized protein n=1 Tax=Epithele typhae TaxID=378194 RepID=UPI0020082158|nr:uncharacterized protein BXZ73DRAFT_54211 [Epithele typhae]XP_047880122.1 uncharacterized protein BXZ73DRAFT_43076 [Epithele typhae]KAH9915598.1 hypothetical protein BXZ73DRAFT_54211 [Epithele typhae]KAH9939997.1 hypothetical protein BXZ73DRAFT_43076 [Epithele typhae]